MFFYKRNTRMFRALPFQITEISVEKLPLERVESSEVDHATNFSFEYLKNSIDNA